MYTFDMAPQLQAVDTGPEPEAAPQFKPEDELLTRITRAGSGAEAMLAEMLQSKPLLYKRSMLAYQQVNGHRPTAQLDARVRSRAEEAAGAEPAEGVGGATSPADGQGADGGSAEAGVDDGAQEPPDFLPVEAVSPELARLIEMTTGERLGEVQVKTDDPALSAGPKGQAEEGLIRLAPGVEPDSREGLEVLAHEAAHLLQLRRPLDMRKARQEAERIRRAEAEAVAIVEAALSGKRRPVEESAPPGLGFVEAVEETQALWEETEAELTAPTAALANEPERGEGTDPDAVGPDGAPQEAAGPEEAAPEQEPEVEEPESDAEMAQAATEASAAVEQSGQERPVQVPPQAGGEGGGEGDPEAEAAAAEKEAEEGAQRIASAVDAAAQAPMDTEADPAPQAELTGRSDLARAAEAQARHTQQTAAARQQARPATEQDFGERQLEPDVDPTADLSPELEGVEVPEFDAAAHVEEAKLERLASEETVGMDLSEVLVVEPPRLEEVLEGPEAAAPEDKRSELQQSRRAEEEAIAEARRQGERERQRLLEEGSRQVDERRQGWQQEQEQLCERHQKEAAEVVQAKSDEATQRKARAEGEADRILGDAEQEASAVERRAKAKAESKKSEADSGKGGWLSRGLDWIKAKVDAVLDAVKDIFAKAKEAIAGLLERARQMAQEVIDAAVAFVGECMDYVLEHLDGLLALLPEELQALAERFKAEIEEVLEGIKARLNQWAQALKDGLQSLLDGLETLLTEGLGVLEGLLETFLTTLEGLLDVDLMAWLKERIPQVAELLEEGLDGLMERVGDAVGGGLEGALSSIGLDGVFDKVQELAGVLTDPAVMGGVAEGCCECFKTLLESLKGVFEAVLDSPAAQGLKDMMQSIQDGADEGALDLLEDFFGVLQEYGGPIYAFIQEVGQAISSAVDGLGAIGQAVWAHIAEALGLDVSLGPLEAIKVKLQQMWDEALEALSPLTEALEAAWAWVKESSPLAPLFDLVEQAGQWVEALGALWDEILADPAAWLASAAERLEQLILPPLLAALEDAQGALSAAADAIEAAVGELLSALGVLDEFQAAVAFLQGIVEAIKAVASGVRQTAEEAAGALQEAVDGLAEGAKSLYESARPLLDFVSGLVVASLLTASGQIWAIPAFVAGNLFLHVLPACYKPPIWDFVIDLFIALIEWAPIPADVNFIGTLLREASLSFLQALKGQDDDAKVKAMDLVASLFAGNLEFAAGLLVGIGKGVWESTVGTVIFIFEAAVWLVQLPGKLYQMASGGGGATAEEDVEADTEELEPEHEDGDEAWEDGVVEGGEDVVEGDTPQQDEEWDDSAADEVEEEAEGFEQEAEPEADAEAEPTSSETSGADLSSDRPPEAPADLPSGKELLKQALTGGFTRQDLQNLLSAANKTVEGLGKALGAEAASGLMSALQAEGAAYDVGEAVGTIVGIVVTEIVLAVLTAGSSTAASGAKGVLLAAKQLPKVAKLLSKLHKAVKPLLKVFKKLKKAIGQWAKKFDEFLAKLLKWVKGKAKQAKAKLKKGKGKKKKGKGKKKKGDADADGKKGKGKGKKKRPKKKRRGLKLVAYRAAKAGWRKAKRKSTKKVVSEASIRAALRGVRVSKPAGAKVKVSLVRRRSTWRVKATARKGVKRASATTGKGWIAKDRQRQRWYTNESQVKKHRRIVREVDQRLDDEARKLLKANRNVQEVFQHLEGSFIPQLESKPSRTLKLLKGITLEIKDTSFQKSLDRGKKSDSKDDKLRFKYVISPNVDEGEVDAEVGETDVLDEVIKAAEETVTTEVKRDSVESRTVEKFKEVAKTDEGFKSDIVEEVRDVLKRDRSLAGGNALVEKIIQGYAKAHLDEFALRSVPEGSGLAEEIEEQCLEEFKDHPNKDGHLKGVAKKSEAVRKFVRKTTTGLKNGLLKDLEPEIENAVEAVLDREGVTDSSERNDYTELGMDSAADKLDELLDDFADELARDLPRDKTVKEEVKKIAEAGWDDAIVAVADNIRLKLDPRKKLLDMSDITEYEGKHLAANTEDEAIAISEGKKGNSRARGASQYWPKGQYVSLIKRTWLNGDFDVQAGGTVFCFEDELSGIGYSEGREATVHRAEWTSFTMHGHPRHHR